MTARAFHEPEPLSAAGKGVQRRFVTCRAVPLAFSGGANPPRSAELKPLDTARFAVLHLGNSDGQRRQRT